ncbi:shikimate dehydrogenase family protein [Arcanobacterium ihumii]|uniref:shikimate dehydrogenase family protein n=1 Tax=Arcanobacterium ihumii TaxID=2138162 RepID=UPI000F5210FE|nr:shikimate dehydrogenase [Arcanobacterium ihumii]
MTELKKAGVVGSPISHSMSPILHLADAEYLDFGRYEVAKGGLREFVVQCDDSWAGLAVTMPLKQEALAMCDMVDGLAKAVGSVNSVVFQPTGTTTMLVGFNTDVAGIVQAVREAGGSTRIYERVAILGSGATASSALAAGIQLGAKEITVCARRLGGPGVFTAAHSLNIDICSVSLDHAATHLINCDLVISTLPAHVADSLAQELREIDSSVSFVLLDAAYDPYPSALVSVAQERGAVIAPGWLMLLHQAVDQIRLFTGKTPDVDKLRLALSAELASRGVTDVYCG